MENNTNKPSPEAKALSLFLMAYKTKDPIYKEKSKYINKRFILVSSGDISKDEYAKEVQDMLESYGGYDEVIEKTVQYYIEKTGEWKLDGSDKYCIDAKAIADKILIK